MKRWTKHASESVHGDGVIYIEFAGEAATRQVSVYGDFWFRGDLVHINELTDCSYRELEFTNSEHITSDEFERVWAEALSREELSRLAPGARE